MEATCSKGWGARCASSKGKKCTCKCGGKNHGKEVGEGALAEPMLPGVPRRSVKFTGRQEYRSLPGEIYHYKGHHEFSSKCGLDIHIRGDRAIVVFTELQDNPGTSITNMIEVLATQVYHERLRKFSPENIEFVEHYLVPDEHHDLVHLKWTGLEYKNPVWRRIMGVKNFFQEGGETDAENHTCPD